MRHRRAAALLLLGFIPASYAQEKTGCPNSTVAEARGAEFAAQAKTFLAKLQLAVKQEDAKQFAALVRYPVRVIGTRSMKVNASQELIRKYPSLMTAKMRQAILEQSGDCMFGNYRGVMIGRGEIWFDEQPDGSMKVITINTTAPGP